MKNIVKAFAVLAGVAALAACNKYADYKWTPFVSLDVRSATVEESDPATTWTLPVHLYNHSGACTVAYTVEAVSATPGVDYTVTDGSGVLTFNGEGTQNITVSISGQPGIYTGNLQFRVKLASATDDVTLGSISTCTVTIKDLDHPLSSMFGDYEFGSVFNTSSGYGYNTWEMTITPVEGYSDRIWIDKITIFQSSNYYGSYIPDGAVYAIVSDDMSTITIPVPQKMGSTAAAAFSVDENFVLYKYDGSNVNADFITSDDVITFTLQDDGSYRTFDSYGLATESYVADGWFWYYMNCFGSFNANYPTYFVMQ